MDGRMPRRTAECRQNVDVPYLSFAQVTVGIRIRWVTKLRSRSVSTVVFDDTAVKLFR